MPDLAARRYGAGPATLVDGGVQSGDPSGARAQQANPVGSIHTGAVHIGSVLDGRYRLDELIGLGGTASVYRGRDTLLDRTVAVKVFHGHHTDPAMAGPAMAARQQLEMQIVARLRHRNLILLHDARNSADGPSYLVLEFVPGPTLARRIEQGPLDAHEVSGIGMGIAGALQTVHAGGLVHRDVKPGNILLDADGEAKLSDFGIARAVAAERITDGADVVGTAPYMSPEQARGNPVGPAADIYPLGLVLLEAITGRREFPGAPVEAAVARLFRDPVIPDDLPAGWSSLLRSMTAFTPDARPSAAEVAAELTALRSGAIRDTRGAAERSAGVRGGRTAPRRHARLAGGLAAAAVALAATVGVFAMHGEDGPGSGLDSGAGSTSITGTPDRQRPAAAGTTAAAPSVAPAQPNGAAQPTRAAPAAVTPEPASPSADGDGNAGQGRGGADTGPGKSQGGGNGHNKTADKPGKAGKDKTGKDKTGNDGTGNDKTVDTPGKDKTADKPAKAGKAGQGG